LSSCIEETSSHINSAPKFFACFIKDKEDIKAEDNGCSEFSDRDLEEQQQQQTHNEIF
jgi:hypothetical protein